MKPIKLSENIKKQLMDEFKKSIDNAKLSNDTIQFTAKINSAINKNISRPKVIFSTEAYLKMMLYVRDTSTEIAWHGTVQKDLEKNLYYISDVFLYPQKLAAATVQTDQNKYNEWITGLDDETHSTLRFQGHSHVNFAAAPSETDLDFYNDMLQVLPENDFYIFMILNKTGDTTLLIYDLESNTIYEKNDIDLYISSDNNQDILGSIKESKDKYCESPAPLRYYNTSPWNYQNYSDKSKTIQDEFLGKNDSIKNPLLDDETEIDTLFNDIDNRWKNATLKTTKKRRNK